MKQNRIFYTIVKNFFKILLIIYNRCSSKWLEKLSPNEKFIVACNHASNLDPLIVGCFSLELCAISQRKNFSQAGFSELA
ncbi:MAG: hypothetical protein IJQ24_02340 [Synergistaceae bacterium]|nr:hypothetical protein [Synergistaceae bacterium]